MSTTQGEREESKTGGYLLVKHREVLKAAAASLQNILILAAAPAASLHPAEEHTETS